MTWTITKEKNRITGEQRVWEYTSACCTLAAGEMIQIQWDVTGDRLILQTSGSEDLELFQSDFLAHAYLLQHEGVPFHDPLWRNRPSRVNFPATPDLQAFTIGIPVLTLIYCVTVTKKRALGHFFSHSPRMGRMKTFQMHSHYIDADIYFQAVLSLAPSAHWKL